MTMQRKVNIIAQNVVSAGGCGLWVWSTFGSYRIGGRDNFFHCETCGLCLQICLKEAHKCVQQASRSNCPVCMEV